MEKGVIYSFKMRLMKSRFFHVCHIAGATPVADARRERAGRRRCGSCGGGVAGGTCRCEWAGLLLAGRVELQAVSRKFQRYRRFRPFQ